MAKEQIDILLSEEFAAAVEENLGRDPLRIALDGRIPNAALVASQVKYLVRAKTKLPNWYSARCILPGLAFEQCSSEATAARKNYSGRVALDLTCGLGVDAFFLSRGFERVVTLERDPFLAAVARENFRRLGARNVQVINASAEEFLAAPISFVVDFGPDVDLVYADPDRRSGGNVHGGFSVVGGGKKMVKLEDCSPDIATLLPDIQQITSKLVVKLSPLFDVDEVFRVFGGSGSGSGSERDGAEGSRGDAEGDPPTHNRVRAEVVSVAGECKEILAEVDFGRQEKPRYRTSTGVRHSSAIPSGKPVGGADDLNEAHVHRSVAAVATGSGEADMIFSANVAEPDVSKNDDPFEPDRYKWLVVPDVALQKARLARRYFSHLNDRDPHARVWIDSDNGYGFSVEKPEEVMGKVIEIQSIEPFNPKNLKRKLKTEKVANVDIMRRNFPLSTVEVDRSLGLSKRRSGSATLALAFTSAAGGLWQIHLVRPA